MKLGAVFAIGFGLAIGACSTTPLPIGTDPGVEIVELAALPAPSQARAIRVTPLSSVEIRVLQDETLDGTYLVDADGTIEFPLIGTVTAGGKRPRAVAQDIAARLDGPFVKNPVVSVRPIEPRQVTSISIGGEVEKPGTYSVDQASTLVRALNEAGGLTEKARHEEVIVFRTVDTRRYIGIYDFSAVMRGNMPDPVLYPGDVVMVGDSPDRARLEAILRAAPLLTVPIILIDRLTD